MTDAVVRRGYLTLHRNPSGRFPLSSLSSKRMWMVLCRKGPSGRPRIEMYRSEDSVGGQQPVRMIDLETVRSVQPVERKKSFLIELPEETMMLQCTSKADMEDWVRDTNRLRGGRVDLASGQNIGGHLPGHDIYEDPFSIDVPDDETFRVALRPTSSIGFAGSCYMEIQRDLNRNLFHIALTTKDEPSRLIVKWQIDHIRQYGSNHAAFKFQSGGKSPTGVGWFIVETESGAAQRIHKAVDYWAKYIVEQIRSVKMNQRPPMHQAHSVPVAQQSPSRHPPPPLSSSMGGSSPYAPLSVSTLDQPPVYQKVSVTATPGRHSATAAARHTPTTADNGSAGVYQPLGVKDAPSAYASVNVSHQGQGGGAVARGSPTPPMREATYMGLRADTRQPDNRETYAVPERN
ncbi:Docking protein 4 [Geodia barretti]|uniref:Docking protein 4 n=1 Tax=Geodia barretti TaxID=519541 RepID=A0AA35SR14_GEOBA|nr:Docking protein 4 [Geodia barretti]